MHQVLTAESERVHRRAYRHKLTLVHVVDEIVVHVQQNEPLVAAITEPHRIAGTVVYVNDVFLTESSIICHGPRLSLQQEPDTDSPPRAPEQRTEDFSCRDRSPIIQAVPEATRNCQAATKFTG